MKRERWGIKFNILRNLIFSYWLFTKKHVFKNERTKMNFDLFSDLLKLKKKHLKERSNNMYFH